MEINVNENPIVIRTLTIGKHKLTKQMLTQVPDDYFVYHLNDKNEKCYGVKKLDSGSYDFKLNGKVLGWINIELLNKYSIKSWAKYTNNQMNDYDGSFYLILCVDENGDLYKSYLDEISNNLIDDTIIIKQLYI